MISIVVCSTNPDLLETLKLNIEQTVGTKYELIVHDNRENKIGLCAVYNALAQTAQFDLLCFVHEDIIMHTHGWGEKLIELLLNPEIGLVGISGAVYKSNYPGTWSTCDRSLYRTNAIQHFVNLEQPVISKINPGNSSSSLVAVIDGVFMATRKDVFNQIGFDEDLLKGFHGYDSDFSLSVGQHYKVVVSNEILLEHLSQGNLSAEWLASSLLVHEKWKHMLPVKVEEIAEDLKKKSDYNSCRSVLAVGLQFPGNKKIVSKYYYHLIRYFFNLNKLNFSKTVLRYLLSK